MNADSLMEKYNIPSSYDLIVPKVGDMVMSTPGGYCAVYLCVLDFGLRFLLPVFVQDLLRRYNFVIGEFTG